MLDDFFNHIKERSEVGIPGLPLTAEQTHSVCQLLEQDLPSAQGEIFGNLLRTRVSPGVDPAARIKADWLSKVARREINTAIISTEDAVFLLGPM